MISTMRDPDVPDWATLTLPDSWEDQLKLSRALDVLKLLQQASA